MAQGIPSRTAAEDARERVPAAARLEFAEKGLAGARIDRISQETSTTKERLHVYFGSKQGLWMEAPTREVVELDRIVDVESSMAVRSWAGCSMTSSAIPCD